MFGDDVLPFDVVEVPVSRRNGFHTRTKNQKRSILGRSQMVHHSPPPILSWLWTPITWCTQQQAHHDLCAALGKHGYRAHCTTHTRAVQRSPCPTLISILCASQSPQAPQICYRHRSQELGISHSLLLVVICLPLVDIICEGKSFNSLIIMRNVLVGESHNSCERWR